jgi:hypothetical protein
MSDIKKIALEEMKRLKPDYKYYGKIERTTLVKFVLVLHGIDPDIYSSKALAYALMFFNNGSSKLLEPENVYVPWIFQEILHEAYKSYMILDSVDWNKKYGNGEFFYLNDLPVRWMIAEAKEKDLKIPKEFAKYFMEACAVQDVACLKTEDKGSKSKDVLPFKNRWVKKGEFYEVNIGNKETIISDTKGSQIIEVLIKQSGKKIHAIELESLISGSSVPEDYKKAISEEESLRHNLNIRKAPEKLASGKTIKVIEHMLADVREELKELKENDDGLDEAIEEKIEKLTKDEKQYNDYLKSVKGKHGKSRSFKDEGDMAQGRVWQAINDVLNKLKNELGNDVYGYLKVRIINRYYCCFLKLEGDAEWEVGISN